MAALAPYVPNKQLAFNSWALNFSTLITANPPLYGLVAGDAVTIAAEYASWLAAFSPTQSPSTKTPEAVQAKNAARVTLTDQYRVYAQQIVANPGVSTANKVALGLNPRTSTPSPVSAPASNPVLTIQSAANLSLIVRYRDSSASPSVKSKPYGCVGCEIYCVTSATPITDPTLIPFKVRATKTPITITFAGTDAAKQAYLAARWVTRTALYSPWSPIASFTIPQGA